VLEVPELDVPELELPELDPGVLDDVVPGMPVVAGVSALPPDVGLAPPVVGAELACAANAGVAATPNAPRAMADTAAAWVQAWRNTVGVGLLVLTVPTG
jgi:hypothetical protein